MLPAPPAAPLSQRGPAEHERREQIIEAADAHFRHYGYSKTTVADLAKVIGLSTAYIYKFFDSKKAIGEAVCSICLGEIAGALNAIADDAKPASDRLRRVFLELARRGAAMFFNDRKMHDIVAAALLENWQPCTVYTDAVHAVVRRIVQEGRDAGEFERKTPLDETTRAIMLTIESVKDPAALERHFDTLEEDAALLAALVLRSLSP